LIHLSVSSDTFAESNQGVGLSVIDTLSMKPRIHIHFALLSLEVEMKRPGGIQDVLLIVSV
jgi:hypothetical protein